MSTATELGTLYMSLAVEGSQIAPTATSAMAEADSIIDRQTRETGQRAGRNLSAGFGLALAGLTAGIGAWAKSNIDELARIETIGAQTDSVLKSTGATSWTTREHIDELSGSLESLTATEGEAITEGANLLLTFKNVQNGVGEGNDIFDQSVAAMTDMARALGTDVAGGAVQLGKALNDPIKGVAALGRVGVGFTEDQKAMITSLTESGNIMDAQKIILAELNAQFGGSGAAYAETYAGKVELLGHAWGTFGETVMSAAMPALLIIMENVGGFITYLNENQWALTMLTSIIGTLLVGAFAMWTASIWASTTALLANPATWIILAIVGAIGLLVAGLAWASDGFTNWGAVGANVLNGLIHGVNGLIHALNGVLRSVEAVLSLGGALGNWDWGNIPTIGLVDVPGLAEGGTVTRTGTTLVGERGPELLRLPRGSSVIPLDHPTASAGFGGDGLTVNLNVSNPVGEPDSYTLAKKRNEIAAALGL